MKTYRITAELSTLHEIEVTAENEAEAFKIAYSADWSEWYPRNEQEDLIILEDSCEEVTNERL